MPLGEPSPTWRKSEATTTTPVIYLSIHSCELNYAHFVPEVGLFITNELQLDIPSITSKLNNKVNEKWLVEEVGRDNVENGVVPSLDLRARAYNHEH